MSVENWIALLSPILVILGGIWYITKLSTKNEINEQRNRDLEKERDRCEAEIKYLRDRIDLKDEVIRNLK